MKANPVAVNAGTETPLLPTPEVAQIIEQLRRMIVDELDVRIKAEEVTDHVPLLEGGLALDSIVLYEFITLIEQRFGFEFADQNLSTEVFASITVLAQHIRNVIAQSKQSVTV